MWVPSTTKEMVAENSVVGDGLGQEVTLVSNTGSGFRPPGLMPLVMVALSLGPSLSVFHFSQL